jgi:hypothetical protein
MKSKFRINSPSKVTEEMGEYLMLGFQEGMEKEMDAPLKAISELSDKMSGAFDPDLSIGQPTAAGLTY